MKLTNTWKHLVVGALVGLIIGFIIKLFAVFELQWFCAFAFTLITIVWENNQRLRTMGERIENESVSEKKKWNWFDSLIDLLVSNAAFYLVYLTIL